MCDLLLQIFPPVLVSIIRQFTQELDGDDIPELCRGLFAFCSRTPSGVRFAALEADRRTVHLGYAFITMNVRLKVDPMVFRSFHLEKEAMGMYICRGYVGVHFSDESRVYSLDGTVQRSSEEGVPKRGIETDFRVAFLFFQYWMS